MKKLKGILAFGLLSMLLLSGASNAHALGAYDWRSIFRNSTNTANVNIDVPIPAGGANGLLGVKGSTSLPEMYTFGHGITPNGSNVVGIGGLDIADTSGLQTALDGKLSSEVDGSVTNELELPAQTGQSGKVLSTDGSSPSWTTQNSGTVTIITAGTGLSGGTITTSGTISLPNVGTAGTYGACTYDAQGRCTSGKRMETYSGTTSGSGTYTVTFGTSYSVAPNIQANIINGTDTQTIRITSVSTTGFTVLVRNRTDTLGLLPSYSNVSGASVDALITEK